MSNSANELLSFLRGGKERDGEKAPLAIKYLKTFLTRESDEVTAAATSARRNQWKKSSTGKKDRHGVPFSATMNTLDLWVIFAKFYRKFFGVVRLF